MIITILLILALACFGYSVFNTSDPVWRRNMALGCMLLVLAALLPLIGAAR